MCLTKPELAPFDIARGAFVCTKISHLLTYRTLFLTQSNMKKFFLLVLVSILICLPVQALAWQRPIHDDGFYKDIAITSVGPLVVTAIINGVSIDVSALDLSGQRQDHVSFRVPSSTEDCSRQRLGISVLPVNQQRYNLKISLVTGDDNITGAYIYSGQINIRRHTAAFAIQSNPVNIQVPTGAKDLAFTTQQNHIYLIWRTSDEDNISTISVGSAEQT